MRTIAWPHYSSYNETYCITRMKVRRFLVKKPVHSSTIAAKTSYIPLSIVSDVTPVNRTQYYISCRPTALGHAGSRGRERERDRGRPGDIRERGHPKGLCARHRSALDFPCIVSGTAVACFVSRNRLAVGNLCDETKNIVSSLHRTSAYSLPWETNTAPPPPSFPPP